MGPRLAEIVSASALSPSVRSLVLRCVDGQALGHQAGQWVNLDVPVSGGGGVTRRAYSVASAPSLQAPDLFEIAVTRVADGAASMALHELPLGTQLPLDGPHGFFTRESERDEPVLWVGTGTGLSPLRAMLEEELARGDAGRPRIALLFGCRTEADVLWGEQLHDWVSEHPRFSLFTTLSRPAPDHFGRSGYVQAHLREVAEVMGRPIVYACGLSRMVQEVRRVLKEELGYDRRRIRTERYD